MHNVLEKCVEKILRAKNEASLTFQKSNFWQLFIPSEYDFQKIDKNGSKLSPNPFYVLYDAESYTKR